MTEADAAGCAMAAAASVGSGGGREERGAGGGGEKKLSISASSAGRLLAAGAVGHAGEEEDADAVCWLVCDAAGGPNGAGCDMVTWRMHRRVWRVLFQVAWTRETRKQGGQEQTERAVSIFVLRVKRYKRTSQMRVNGYTCTV